MICGLPGLIWSPAFPTAARYQAVGRAEAATEAVQGEEGRGTLGLPARNVSLPVCWWKMCWNIWGVYTHGPWCQNLSIFDPPKKLVETRWNLWSLSVTGFVWPRKAGSCPPRNWGHEPCAVTLCNFCLIIYVQAAALSYPINALVTPAPWHTELPQGKQKLPQVDICIGTPIWNHHLFNGFNLSIVRFTCIDTASNRTNQYVISMFQMHVPNGTLQKPSFRQIHEPTRKQNPPARHSDLPQGKRSYPRWRFLLAQTPGSVVLQWL